MSRYPRSKSSTFLMELILNLLLFCLLCSSGLLFFSKSFNLTKDTTVLHQAVSMASSVASIYESSNGSFDTFKALYPCENISDEVIKMYFDEQFNYCLKEDAAYYLLATVSYDSYRTRCLELIIRKTNGDPLYNLTTYHHSQATLGQVKEAQHDSN